jgi:hypothetical protein
MGQAHSSVLIDPILCCGCDNSNQMSFEAVAKLPPGLQEDLRRQGYSDGDGKKWHSGSAPQHANHTEQQRNGSKGPKAPLIRPLQAYTAEPRKPSMQGDGGDGGENMGDRRDLTQSERIQKALQQLVGTFDIDAKEKQAENKNPMSKNPKLASEGGGTKTIYTGDSSRLIKCRK